MHYPHFDTQTHLTLQSLQLLLEAHLLLFRGAMLRINIDQPLGQLLLVELLLAHALRQFLGSTSGSREQQCKT